MSQPDLQQIRAAVAREPKNAELHYLLGAELAQQREYDAAVVEMSTALALDPNLHFARFQLGLLYLTMAKPAQSLETWQLLETLDDSAALKTFKRGLEALIRDDFAGCRDLLRLGISQNTQNAPLNRDMSLVIERVNGALASQPPSRSQPQPPQPSTAPPAPGPVAPVRTDFSLYSDPSDTKH
jgi:tetratricopeptide (TPR) repeat protein